ncbi:MAG: hypothetical protein K0U98_17640 [Deltaproteobacteria bacterium]|nr:hypothetical protein [Deltaproteobacteria bacterium]
MSFIRTIVGTIGAYVIYLLMWLFGSRRRAAENPWLAGPVGGPYIGDEPYEKTAREEGLSLERQAGAGGLLTDFSALESPTFHSSQVDPKIRDFYEGTAGFSLDTWATTYFPARLALWLLVQTISRRVNQLNFPLDGLEMARGMTSEIVLLRRPEGSIKYTGWYRCIRATGRSIYTGFYMTESIPAQEGNCVKVVFPMPNGNATVILRPENCPHGGLKLTSAGNSFGDVGFYRIGKRRDGTLRVWRVQSLHEEFHLYVEEGELRCDHAVRFLGFPVLSLHFRITGSPSRVADSGIS